MCVSIFVAVIQLIVELRKQKWEAFFYLHQYLSQAQFNEARKHVRTNLVNVPYDFWDEADKKYANSVCACYDQAGILIQAGILNAKTLHSFLSSSWGQSIIDQYETLIPFLEEQQTPTKTGKEFFKHFVWLYETTKGIYE